MATKLVLATNLRFGYSYLYPEGWTRFDPENSDGSSLFSPEDSEVTIIAFGQYAAALESLDELVDFVASSEAQKSKFALLSDEVVPIRTQGRSGGTLSGRRIAFQYGDIRCVQVFAQTQGVQYSIRCAAPILKFPNYEALFSDVLRGLEILTKES